MSVYNGEKYLREAIDSILNQTFTNFEFIIIDDASTDDSNAIIKKYTDKRIKLVENPQNMGLTKSLNRGLKISLGKYIARLDSDDLAFPNRLKEQYEFMEKNPHIFIAGSFMKIIDESGNLISINKIYTSPNIIKLLFLFKNPLLHSSIIIRHFKLKNLNFYNENYPYAQDLELYSRAIRKNYSLAVIPKILVSSRIHDDTISKNFKSNNLQRNARKEICLNNISKYIVLSSENKKNLQKALWEENICSFKNLLITYIILHKLKKYFISKENPSLDEIKIISLEINKRSRPLFKIYLKNTYPKIHQLLKKLF